jgi:CubicO group peptidase (beta-lactamase class C family)
MSEVKAFGVRRRQFLAGGLAAAVAPAGAVARTAGHASAIDRFAQAYVETKGAPGMILALADIHGASATRHFGFADVEARRPIGPRDQFQIGSITKSFAAFMVMQLVDEGRIALDHDIRTYLSDLDLHTPFGPVTIHHLLCHASGLPGSAPPPGWAGARTEQAFAPGSAFHYCNYGYTLLGQLIERVERADWAAVLRRRILEPLAMTDTSPTIGAAHRPFEVPSYVPLQNDRPYPPRGRLVRAGPLTFASAAGCIVSTATDMSRYIAMIARGGVGPQGRLVSERAFKAMTSPQIKAPELGSDSHYGYGVVIETVDGRPIVRHTGGMVSFMSAFHVDVDAGVGAFASINAQQGYRPIPVTRFALKAMRAHRRGVGAGAPPDIEPPVPLADYPGRYAHRDGRVAVVERRGTGIALRLDGRITPLVPLGGDLFAATQGGPPEVLAVRFARAPTAIGSAAPGKVVALEWARDAFARMGAATPDGSDGERDAGPARVTPEGLASLEGLYIADSPWLPAVRVVARSGQLWLDGVLPLSPLDESRFRLADKPDNPETVAFSRDSAGVPIMAFDGVALTRAGDVLSAL